MSLSIIPCSALPSNQQARAHAAALEVIGRVWPRWLMEAEGAHAGAYPVDWPVLFERWPHLQQLLCDENGRCLGVANSIPLAWNAEAERLPDEGWDWAYQSGMADHQAQRPSKTLCALAVTLDPAVQGQGWSPAMLHALKAAARQAGLQRLIVPVRPNRKDQHPWLSMEAYLQHRTADGLPTDPWLRTHVRLSGQVVRVCAKSMQLQGRIEDWTRWLSTPVTAQPQQALPTLLSPLVVNAVTGMGRYVEPNVWVEHPLR